MLLHSASQSDNQPSSIAKSSQQLWVSAACPAVDHDACPESEISSSRRPPLSPTIIAVAGGNAVANLYYNQPMLPDIGRSFGVAADVIAFLPILTQIGYALGLFLFVPLGDIVDRHQLVLRLFFGIIASQLALALSLVWLDVASLMLGMMSVVVQVLVALAGQLGPPQHRGRIVGTLQAGILAGIVLARTVSEHVGWRPMLWLAAAMDLGVLVVLHRVLRRTPPPHPRLLRSLKDLWRSYPELRTSSLIGAVLFAAFSVFWSAFAFRLGELPFGYGPQVVGLFWVLGVSGATSAPLAGDLTDRRGAGFTVAVGTVATATAFVVFMLAGSSLTMLAVEVVLLDVGIQAAMNGNQSAVLSLAPQATSRTDTIYMVIYPVGGALGSYTGGLAWHHFGWSGTTAPRLLSSGAAVCARFGVWMPATAGVINRT
jgi:predicted MFS family arabinose efflux permease